MNDDEIKVVEISGAWKFYIGKQDRMKRKILKRATTAIA